MGLPLNFLVCAGGLCSEWGLDSWGFGQPWRSRPSPQCGASAGSTAFQARCRWHFPHGHRQAQFESGTSERVISGQVGCLESGTDEVVGDSDSANPWVWIGFFCLQFNSDELTNSNYDPNSVFAIGEWEYPGS